MEIKDKDQEKGHIEINNKEGVKKYLKDINFPIYFLDFEAVTNSKEWMYTHGLDIDQQLSSFSFLKINSLKDDETKIKHFNFVGQKEDYKLMAKKLTDFYTDKNGTVVVWGIDLELRGLAKLMRASKDSKHKKISLIIANMIDLQQLFYTGSFIKYEPTGKSSLDSIAKAYGIYLSTTVKDGKKAHFILSHAIKENIDKSHLLNIKRRIEKYNNSDVINIKRVLVEIINSLVE